MATPIIVGTYRVAKQPNYSVTQAGSPICNLFLIASDSRKREDGTWEDSRKFAIGATVWGSLAEIAGNFEVGDEVHVTGRIYDDEYQGVTRPKINVDSLGKGRARKNAQPPPADDPWASALPAGQGGYSDESPF